jgi:segregation and condensation protein B
MGRRAKPTAGFDRELPELPPPLRWREYMMRVEAVIFASSQPVAREALVPLIGSDCNLDLLIADVRDELRARPYELVAVAGGFQYRTRPLYAAVIRSAGTVATPRIALSALEQLVLTAIAYFQPITRAAIADIIGKKISRDMIAFLRNAKLIAAGPRSPQPGAPYTYVTTPDFLVLGGFQSLRDLPDLDKLEDAGLLGSAPLPEELREALGITGDAEHEDEEDVADIEADEEYTGVESFEE